MVGRLLLDFLHFFSKVFDPRITLVTLRAQDDASPPGTSEIALLLTVDPAGAPVPALSPLGWGFLVAGLGLLARRRLREPRS